MSTVDELTTPLTVDEVREAIYTTLATNGVTTTAWKPGAVVRTIIAAVAIVCSALSRLIALVARSGFLETAEGLWLTLVARYVYGVRRIEATFASGTVVLNNTGGGVYALDPDDLVLLNTATGKTYRNTTAIAIGALQTGVVVAVQAVEAGSASTALPGEIDAFETPLLGVNIVQAAAIVGTDAEEDPELRLRCNEKLGSLSPNGPSDAYSFVAKSTLRANGTPISVTRVRTVKDGLGGLDVYCATATGGVSGTANDPATDLGAINEEIQRLASPLCVTARVHSAIVVPVPITYSVWLYKSTALTEQQIKDAIALELTNYLRTQPIGGNVVEGTSARLFATALSAVIGRARTSTGALLGVFRVELTLPAADVPLGIAEVATLGTVTATAIHQLSAPQGTAVS